MEDGSARSRSEHFRSRRSRKTHRFRPRTSGSLQEIARRFEETVRGREAAEANRLATEVERAKLEKEIADLRAEVAAIKAANMKVADAHDYNEAQTA